MTVALASDSQKLVRDCDKPFQAVDENRIGFQLLAEQVGVAQFGVAQVGVAQFGVAQVGVAQVGVAAIVQNITCESVLDLHTSPYG